MLNLLFRPFRGAGRPQGTSVFWVLAITAAVLLLSGWFLPWAVTGFSSGIGFSAQDAVSSAPTGVATILLYVLGALMLVLVLSPVLELGARITKRPLPQRADFLRMVAAITGLVLTIVVWFLVFCFSRYSRRFPPRCSRNDSHQLDR